MRNFRMKFSKVGNMIYISHLDLMRTFQRAFRRADIMVKHTEGFNPQPKIAFATALALGTSSDGEYMDVELESEISPDELLERLNKSLPEGLKLLKVVEKTEKDSIMSMIEWSQYVVKVNASEDISMEVVEGEIQKLLSLDEIIEIKEKKKKNKMVRREVNIRPNIKSLELMVVEGQELILKMFLKTGSNGNLKPDTVINKLLELTGLDLIENSIKIHRVDLFVEAEDKIVTPI